MNHSHFQNSILSLLLLSLFNHIVYSELCNPYDKNILLQIKAQYPDPLISWNPDRDCCTEWWYNPYTSTLFDFGCDDQGHVTTIRMNWVQDIPSDFLLALGQLPNLESISLGDFFDIPTQIPPEICTKLINLKSLSIVRSNLHGSIPDCLGQLRNLNYLDLSYNSLTGEIPPSLSNLPNLQILNLYKNQLYGTIPDFSGASAGLYSLSLGYNSFSGAIPDHLGLLSSLSTLILAANQFNGSIPSFLGHMDNLLWLDLSSNQLTGSIPESLGQLVKPNSLALTLLLQNNQLSGTVPESLGQLIFFELNLSNNKLKGDAFFLFGSNQTRGRTIDISKNHFRFNFSESNPPQGLLNLNISHNKIYGSFPITLGRVPYFESFDVSYNKLCGPIPSDQGWERYNKIYFSHNKCLCGPPLAACTK